MKVLYFSDIPSPYSVAYINELGKLADVTAVYETLSSKERDASWKFFEAPNVKLIIMKGLLLGPRKKLTLDAFKFIWKFRQSKIIIANPLTLCGIMSIFFCKLLRIPFILQSEGGLAKNGKGLKEHFKKFVMQGATLYLSGMNPKNDYFLTYGATAEKIKQYPFSSLYRKDFPDRICFSSNKNTFKESLGMSSKPMILYVGRFLHVKGVDILLHAFAKLKNEANLYLVGGMETPEHRKILSEKNIKNVHYVDFVGITELRKYYSAADVFVLPTRSDTWGLVINEAMTYGLSIVTTDRCVAGLELIDNGINGYLVPSENPKALAEKIDFLLDNPNLRDKIALNNFEKIKDYNYENMARVIYNHLLTLDI